MNKKVERSSGKPVGSIASRDKSQTGRVAAENMTVTVASPRGESQKKGHPSKQLKVTGATASKGE